MGFPASPADYRCAPGPEIRRPPDYRKSGRSPRVHDAVRAAIWRTGKLKFWEPARPGVGHVDAGPTLPGVRARGALAGRAWVPPWPGGARPPRREGSAFGTNERGVSAQSGLATGT